MRWSGFALSFSLLALGVQLLEGYRGWGWLVASSLLFGCGFAWMLWLVVWLRPGEAGAGSALGPSADRPPDRTA